jgi:anti-sigma regulatory factor (Ser/Thr protein kinase)
MNAVEHGNKNIYEKQITICYTIEPSCFHLSVEDEGKGFDLNHILHSTPSRGLSMIEILSNSLNINRRGNQISITYKLG